MGKNALFLIALATVASGCIGEFATDAELRAQMARNNKATTDALVGPDASDKDLRRIAETRVSADVAEDAMAVETEAEAVEETATAEPQPEVEDADAEISNDTDTNEVEVEVAVEATVVAPDVVEEATVTEEASVAEEATVEPQPEVVEEVPDAETDADTKVANDTDTNEVEVEVAVEATVVAPDVVEGAEVVEQAPEVVAEVDTVDTVDAPDPCAAKNCNDGNVCTEDLCTQKAGTAMCINLPLSATTCDDGNACTLGDQCNTGVCKAGSQKSCDDGNACTSDICTSTTGQCKFAPVTPYLSESFENATLDSLKAKGWKFSVSEPAKQAWSITTSTEKVKDGAAALGVYNTVLGSEIVAEIALPTLQGGAKLKLYAIFFHHSQSAGYALGVRGLDKDGKEVLYDALAGAQNGEDKTFLKDVPQQTVKLQLFLKGGYQVATSAVSAFDALQIAHPQCLK